MSTIFRGMSKDNFLDGLVNATGKNGHDLYDYLRGLIGDDAKLRRESNTTVMPRTDEVIEFSGTRAEFVDYCKLRGVVSEHDANCGITIEGWMNALAKATGASRIVYHYPVTVYSIKTKETRKSFDTITLNYDEIS